MSLLSLEEEAQVKKVEVAVQVAFEISSPRLSLLEILIP
jgi:hypothetical protein